MISCGSVQAKFCRPALNLGVLPMIVPPAARCGHGHCLFAMLSDFFETVNSPFLVRRLEALSFRRNIAR